MNLIINKKLYEGVSDTNLGILFNENGININDCEREDAGLSVNFIKDGRIVAIVENNNITK